jgi:hypothetical protein
MTPREIDLAEQVLVVAEHRLGAPVSAMELIGFGR